MFFKDARKLWFGLCLGDGHNCPVRHAHKAFIMSDLSFYTYALQAAIDAPCFFHRWQPEAPQNPFHAMLGLAGRIVVTADSVSMMAEAVSTSKPVLLFDIEEGPYAMREAPDLLMIGEIRDKPTLQIALLFAQTGHLCMSTLHANNSYHALNRIINFFPREARDALFADLAISLRCVISQRLVRSKDGGRLPAIEIMQNTAHISELIKKGEINEIKDAMEQSLAPGSQTFEQSLYQLYSSGQITLENALANADSATNLHWLISNAGKPPTDAGKNDEPSQPGVPSAPADDLSSIKLNLDMV